MRSFPRARRAVVAALLGATASSVLAVPLAGADHGRHGLDHRRDAVRGRIHAASADLDDASREVLAATRAVARARTRLQHARTHAGAVHVRLQEARTDSTRLRTRLTTSRGHLAEVSADLVTAGDAVEDQRTRVRTTVLGTYEEGDVQLRALGALMTSPSLDDLGAELAGQSLIAQRGAQTFGDLSLAQDHLSGQRTTVARATADVALRTHAAAVQLGRVRVLYAAARTAKQRVATLVTRTVRARRHAFVVRRHDRAVLQRLRGREAAIRKRILALAAHERGGYTGAARGYLSYPATGYPVTSPYGYRVHPIYGYYSLHDGDDFGVPCGTPLHAAASGTVISAYADPVWGNRIFLSLGRVDGHDLTVVYNHLSRTLAHPGQHVARGEVVGLSGTTGWSTGCHLHLTVLRDGTAVDPMTYL